MSVYVKTAFAAPALQLSQGYLKLQMDDKGGPLKKGVHYILGPSKNSPIKWNVEACRAEFHRKGMLLRQADQFLAANGISDKNLTERV